MRVVVVDDEKPARDRLRRMLGTHADVTIVGEAGSVDEAVALLDAQKPDLLLLDVQMPGGTGFDVLERAKQVPRVVFTTAYDQYAVRAFEVHSLDYLLKPFPKERLDAALARAREAMRRSAPEPESVLKLLEEIRAGLPGGEPPPSKSSPTPVRIPAKRGQKILLLDPAEVAWFEADDTLVHARVGEHRYLVERPLADLEEMLGATFFRTHRRFLVNLSRIAEILPAEGGTYHVVLRDEARSVVPLSRRQAQRLRELIPW